MAIHDDHRERLRRQFLKRGDSFEAYQLLELLLFYSKPRVDTNPTAHMLIDNFGGLKELLDAPIEEIQKVDGIGERSALLIKLVQQLAIAYAEPDYSAVIANDSAASGALLWPKFMGERNEIVYMMCLDAKNKVLGINEVGRGDIDYTPLDVKRVVQTALSRNAASVVLAHNHPSGMAVPSEADRRVTADVQHALGLMGIALLDHLVMADGDFVSMRDSGLM